MMLQRLLHVQDSPDKIEDRILSMRFVTILGFWYDKELEGAIVNTEDGWLYTPLVPDDYWEFCHEMTNPQCNPNYVFIAAQYEEDEEE